MANYCAFCTHLDEYKKDEGKYYCKVLGRYILTCDETNCGSYEEAGRAKLTSELICDDSQIRKRHDSISASRYCCDCKFYEVDDPDGSGYYNCSKRNKKMPANNKECYLFDSSGRSNHEKNTIYEEAKTNQREEKLKGSKSPSLIGIILLLLLLGIIILLDGVFHIL